MRAIRSYALLVVVIAAIGFIGTLATVSPADFGGGELL